MKKVIVFGNIGQGKSTLLNKLAYIINKLENNVDQEDFVHFEAKRATKSVTVDVHSYSAGDITLLDTPGFGDPAVNQYELWNKLVINLLNKEEAQLDKNGVASIIFVIMIPQGARVDNENIQLLYETLMLLTVIYPDFDPISHKCPKILVCLQGDQMEHFEDFKNAIYEYLAFKIIKQFHNTQFDFNSGSTQALYWKSQHSWQGGDVSNVKQILISNKQMVKNYDQAIENIYNIYSLAMYIKEDPRYEDCIGFSIHRNFFKPNDPSERLCWVIIKNNNRSPFINKKIETYYWDQKTAQEPPGQPKTDDDAEMCDLDSGEVQTNAVMQKLKIMIPDENFFFQGHAKLKHTSKTGEQIVEQEDMNQVEMMYSCIKLSQPMTMSNLFNPFQQLPNQQQMSKDQQDQCQQQLEQWSLFTPPELNDTMVNQCAENVYRILENLINAIRTHVDEQNLQIEDENGQNYDRNLAHFIETVNFSKQRMQECLGQDKTFVLQKANNYFFAYIGKLIVIMNDEFFETLLQSMVKDSGMGVGGQMLTYIEKMEGASTF